jgi:hypothetical protein
MSPNLDQIQVVLDSAAATPWERAFAFGVLRHHIAGRQTTEKQSAALEKVSASVASRFESFSPDLPQKPGQNDRDGTRARI